MAKSKVTAAIAEIAAGKTAFELAKNEGTTFTNASASDIGLQGTTQNCTITLSDGDGVDGKIKCVLLNAPAAVIGATVQWTRNASSGEWTCGTKAKTGGAKLESKYVGSGCSNLASS
ncbi:pilin [Endozoicomonas ascidiicola]|uniref:pilin n=1 Tax=Endozoicomonas ascidiicola TaxID=1698521 RepID=UPI003CCC3D67